MQFVDIGSRECYVGMLYACYDLIKPDVILEISWRNGLHDFTMVCLLYPRSFLMLMINAAFHDQHALTTILHDRDAQKGQRRAQAARGVTTEERRGHTHSRWHQANADARPGGTDAESRSVWAAEWDRVTGHGFQGFLGRLPRRWIYTDVADELEALGMER